jgi:hypothetical protein
MQRRRDDWTAVFRFAIFFTVRLLEMENFSDEKKKTKNLNSIPRSFDKSLNRKKKAAQRACLENRI